VAVCVYKETKQKNRLAHSNSKKKQSTALGVPCVVFRSALRGRVRVPMYIEP